MQFSFQVDYRLKLSGSAFPALQEFSTKFLQWQKLHWDKECYSSETKTMCTVPSTMKKGREGKLVQNQTALSTWNLERIIHLCQEFAPS
jgi:hypothetical protein